MKLYWHRWKTKRLGTSYYLQIEPWNGDEASRLLGSQIASVTRTPGLGSRWGYTISQVGRMPGTWGFVGSPVRARNIVEAYLDRKSIAAFNDDLLEIVPAAK